MFHKKASIRAFLAVSLCVIMLMALAVPALAASPETVKFVHTNDVHGHLGIEPYVKAVADALKKELGDQNVITASAGDIFAGGEAVAHLTNGESVVETMTAAGYDVAAVGNNDIPQRDLARLMQHDKDGSFDIICANLAFSEDAGDLGTAGELPLAPYKTFTTAGGVKIGVFGLTTTGSPPLTGGESFVKLPSIETAEKYVEILKNEEKCDVIVALGHCGWPDNDETMSAVTATDANSYQISMAVDGIDLFIDGHTHSVIGEGKGYVCDNASKTLIVQTGCFGDNIGVVTMTIDPDSKTVTAKSAEQITKEQYEKDYTPDAATQEIVDRWVKMIDDKLGSVVGHTDYYLNGERTGSEDGMGIRLAEQNLGNLVADAIRDTTGADISVFSGVRIRASIKAGDITLLDCYNVFANGGTVNKKEMTGAEVKELLKKAVSSAAGGKESPGFVQVSGIQFVYDTEGEIVSVKLESDGSELEDDKTYLVIGEGVRGDGVETLYDGDEALVGLFTAYLASDKYDAAKYEGKLGRITRVEAAPKSGVHFEKTAKYEGFSDVEEGAWYEANVKGACELGLMIGKGEGVFDPEGEVRVDEAITMAARILATYKGETAKLSAEGGDWFAPYKAYAIENGIVDEATAADAAKAIDRGLFAQILAKALPAEGLETINEIKEGSIPGVEADKAYAEAVYTLYRAGVLTGTDDKGSFTPDRTLMRAEAAAVVSRMAESDNRLPVKLG